MWDTWLYSHAGTYYLYYLARSGEQWDNISMATSSNGVNWEEIGPILRKGEGSHVAGHGFDLESSECIREQTLSDELLGMDWSQTDDIFRRVG